MSTPSLASEISDYVTSATGLEFRRQHLVDRIMQICRDEIIPELSPLLPERYTLNTKTMEVKGLDAEPSMHVESHFRRSSETVPITFGVYLALLYNGKGICHIQSGVVDSGVAKIQKDLKPKLDELARRYNLAYVSPTGGAPFPP